MTPELKVACELVFQEHKSSRQPIKWSRDAFRGRISIGLSEMAKETLVKKKIILLPNKTKKTFTQLNPEVATAGSFEEAEQIIDGKITVIPAILESVPDFVTEEAPVPLSPTAREILEEDPEPIQVSVYQPPSSIELSPIAATVYDDGAVEAKWWLKPVYLYFIWPLCGAAGGALISFLMNFLYTELFTNR